MRPTWHFVAPADIRWMLRLTAPRVNASNSHYHRKLELDDAVFRRSNKALAAALRGGKQLTRDVFVIGGRVVGRWKRSFKENSVVITLSPFVPFSKADRQAVDDAAHRYGTFLGLRVLFA